MFVKPFPDFRNGAICGVVVDYERMMNYLTLEQHGVQALLDKVFNIEARDYYSRFVH